MRHPWSCIRKGSKENSIPYPLSPSSKMFANIETCWILLLGKGRSGDEQKWFNGEDNASLRNHRLPTCPEDTTGDLRAKYDWSRKIRLDRPRNNTSAHGIRGQTKPNGIILISLVQYRDT